MVLALETNTKPNRLGRETPTDRPTDRTTYLRSQLPEANNGVVIFNQQPQVCTGTVLYLV